MHAFTVLANTVLYWGKF